MIHQNILLQQPALQAALTAQCIAQSQSPLASQAAQHAPKHLPAQPLETENEAHPSQQGQPGSILPEENPQTKATATSQELSVAQ